MKLLDEQYLNEHECKGNHTEINEHFSTNSRNLPAQAQGGKQYKQGGEQQCGYKSGKEYNIPSLNHKKPSSASLSEKMVKRADSEKIGEIGPVIRCRPDVENILSYKRMLSHDHGQDRAVVYSVSHYIEAICLVKAQARTGVEMEAIVGVTTALNTLWDVVKYLEKDERGQYPTTKLTDIRVIKKEKAE